MNWEYLRQIYQRYFTFTRSERYGVIVLSAMILIFIIVSYTLPLLDKPEPTDFTEFKKMIAEMRDLNASNEQFATGKLFLFNPNIISETDLDSLLLPDNVKNNLIKYREKGGVFKDKESFRRLYGMNDSIFLSIEPYLIIKQVLKKKEEEPKIIADETNTAMFFFDPNTVSEDDLLKLGLSPRQAGNIIKYRDKGGKFRNGSDFAKIYGLDSITYQKISPWIRIENVNDKVDLESPKISEKIIIELNSSDSVTLIELPGIGPVMASRIIKFRQSLGGFYNSNQLLEIYGMKTDTYELIQPMIEVDTSLIRQISLNFSDYEDLVKHPYISGNDAKNIIKYRNKKGPYETCSDLESKKVIEGSAYFKLRPYLKLN